MDFWTRLKKRIKICKQTQEGVSVDINVPFGTFRKWMDRRTYPDANEVVKLAVLLKTTVEELVDGEAGAEYVRQLASKEGWGFSPPDRIADIVEGLSLLDDNEIDMIRGAVMTVVERKKGKVPGKRRPPKAKPETEGKFDK